MKEIKAFIEIPAFLTYKYELQKDSGILILDRPLNQAIPANYGFISSPETLAEDNDPLDVFVLSGSPLIAGSECKIEVIGAFLCTDAETPDHKLIATLKDEIPWHRPFDDQTIINIQTYLETYKEGFKVIKQVGKEEALQILSNSYTVKNISK